MQSNPSGSDSAGTRTPCSVKVPGILCGGMTPPYEQPAESQMQYLRRLAEERDRQILEEYQDEELSEE
jgi:hypothetical protein